MARQSQHRNRCIVLRLPRRELAKKDVVERLVARVERRSCVRTQLTCAFAFKDSELAFARSLAQRTHLWVYRVNQRAFGGDFVIVDVSCPIPDRRIAIVLDLKRGRYIREDRPGIQMRHAALALESIAESGVVSRSSPIVYLTGDFRFVLTSLEETIRRHRRVSRASSTR